MKKNEWEDGMKEEIARALDAPMFLSRVGWTYHPPTYDASGRFRYGFPETDAFVELCERFARAGVKTFLSNLPVGWIGEETCDFRSMDETLSAFFSAIPDAHYIPRLRLDPSFLWMERHPEELCVFENESTDPRVIAALVREGRVNNTYDMDAPPQANGLQPLRLDEPIGLQSFSSALWLDAACRVLEKTLRHLLCGPYGDRFIGFHLCFGGTCELLHWGNGGARIGDFSRKHSLAFYDFALRKYGSENAVRAAWEQPALTRENCVAPSARLRSRVARTVDELYRRDGVGCYVRDYELFHSESVANAALALARVAKRVAPDRAVGIFYGYEGYGHEHLDRILASEDIDYLSAPKPYGDPAPGGRGGSVAKVASVMTRKRWIEELDNRLHTSWDPRKFAAHVNVAPTASLAESANVLWRELCKLEQEGASFWWMDQGDARHRWYDSDEIMEIIKTQVRVHTALRASPAADLCEVAVIGDTDANYTGSLPRTLAVRARMLLSGVPFHEYRIQDVDVIDLSRFRLLVFTQPQLLSAEPLSAIRARLSEGAQILFTDLPGICTAEGLAAVEELTGMAVVPDATLSFRFADGEEGALRRRDNLWLLLKPDELLKHLPTVLDKSGVFRPVKSPAVVHGNDKLFGVFATHDSGICERIRLPHRGDYVEWFTGVEYADTESVLCDIPPKGARVFLARELWEAIKDHNEKI